MRYSLVILSAFLMLISADFSFAQQNLSDVFDKWKDGEYKYFRNWGDQELNMVEETMKKAKVQFLKNSKTGAKKIYIDGTNDNGAYEDTHYGETDFIRYFTWSKDQKVHITGSSIIIYKISETFHKTEVTKILGCIGKKISQKDVNNLVSHLNETKKYWVPHYAIDASDQIVNIKAIPLFQEGQTSLAVNQNFTIGIEIEYSWGIKAKTINLGGSMKSDSYVVLSKDVLYSKKEAFLDNTITLTPNCQYIKNNTLKLVGKAGGKEFTLELPLNCDADNSPALVYARKWSQFDEIGFTLKNGENNERKTFKNDYGFLHCALELQQAFKENQNNKNYVVRVSKGGKFGWTDLNANLLIPCEYEGGTMGALENTVIAVRKDGKWGYINFQNKILGQIKYDMVFDFYKGYGKVELNKKQGFVNQNGAEIVKPEYDKVWAFNHGAVVVQKGEKYGFVRENGTVIGSINYEDAFDFNAYKYGAVKNNGKYGLIDLSGNTILALEQPDLPATLANDLFKIKKNGLYGVVNKTGKVVANFEFDEIYPTGYASKEAKSRESELVFRVKKGYYYGYYKSDGSMISDCIFSEATDFLDGIAWVTLVDYDNKITKKGRYSLADRQTSWLEEIPFKTDDATSTTNSTSKKSSTKNTATSDKKTIKNTGRKILHMGADGATGFSLNPGSSREFPCRQKIYYTYYENNGYNGKGPVISAGGEDCGATLNANGDQYHSK